MNGGFWDIEPVLRGEKEHVGIRERNGSYISFFTTVSNRFFMSSFPIGAMYSFKTGMKLPTFKER